MGLSFTPYSIPLLAGAGLICLVAFFIVKQKKSQIARYMAVTNVLIAVYVFGYGMELNQTAIQGSLFWAKIEYIGITITPIALLFVTLAFTGRQRWLTNPFKAILLFIPCLTIFFAWTNEYYQWLWQNPTLVTVGTLSLFDFAPGPWYWINVLSIYLVILFCVLLMIMQYKNAPEVHRVQIRLFMLGLAIPITAHLFYLASVIARLPLLMINWQAYAFILLAVLISFSIVNYQLLEIVPVARDAIFENMEDGVIVLDGKNRVADLNPSAQSTFGWDRASIIGKPITELAIAGDQNHSLGPVELSGSKAEINAGESIFEMSISPFGKNHGSPNGRLIVLRDISTRKQAENDLNQAHANLQQQYSKVKALQKQLKKQALLDPLTGLYNRRYLEETLVPAIGAAQKEGYQLSLVILDIDHFKTINDRFGHAAGDRMLQELGKLLKSKTRKADAACRFGGDEFVLVLPGAGPLVALERTNAIRKEFAAHCMVHHGHQISATLSAGIAVFPDHSYTSEEIIWAADHSLYEAKLAGRNCIKIND